MKIELEAALRDSKATTSELKEVLSKITNNVISDILLNEDEIPDDHLNIKKTLNYIDLSKTHKGYLSYLTQDRIDKISEDPDEDFWNPKLRYFGKPGSVMKKLLSIDNWTIENFSNQFQAIIDPPNYRLELVRGRDIAKYYNPSNHSQRGGTLGNSCMNNAESDVFDFYVKNENVIGMLVMLDQHDKVLGRAIFWDDGKGFKFMDRIYIYNDI
jgi:hypothetical protein